MSGRTGRNRTGEQDLVVVMTCKWCGRPITLTPSESGPQVPDVDAFLAVHGRCLERAAAEAREEPSADDTDSADDTGSPGDSGSIR